MPVFSPTTQKQITPSTTPSGKRKAERRSFQLINQQGVPRFDDLITVRLLEQTPTISLPMNTAKRQATRIPFEIEPTVERPTVKHEMIADRLYDWFDGGFNRDNESWDYFLKLLLNDLISIDTAPIELVPSEEKLPHPQTGERMHFAKEMYAVDGSVVSKNLTKKDTIPKPPEAAYYKYGNLPNVHQRFSDRSTDITNLFRSSSLIRFSRGGQVKPVPYSRDEMAVIEENPRPRQTSPYGYGIIQQARRWAEILLNQDLSNIQHFSDDELAKGVFNIGIENADQVESFREYWKDEVRGSTDTALPIAALDDSAEWMPFQPSLKELQYLESQQWYSELVWYLFGQTQSEIGQTEDANVSTSEHDTYQVFTNTTRPRLRTIEQTLNNFVLPKLRDYWIVDGEVKFSFNYDEHPIVQEKKQNKRRDDLQNSVVTVNEIREAEGKDPLAWGDAPPEAMGSFVREHPEWAMENWGDVENVPEPQSDPAGGLFSHSPRKSVSESIEDGVDDALNGDFADSEELEEAFKSDGDSGNGNEPVSYETALKNPDAYLAKNDESLRNEHGEYVDLKQYVDQGQQNIATVFKEHLLALEDEIETAFPDDRQEKTTEVKALGIDVDTLLDGVDMTDALTGAMSKVIADSMEETAESDKNDVQQELSDAIGDPDVDLEMSFDVRDTFAFERMQEKAASNMVTVNDTVKDRIRNELLSVAEGDHPVVEDYVEGGNVTDATEALRETVDELSDSHARLVARTETLDASRHGSQAFQEQSDVVGGKEWIATDDNRTRPWHDAMDGTVVDVDADFTVPSGWEGEPHYQSSDYPRTAFVVGDDQPYHCRCEQRSVLNENLPDDVRELRSFDELDISVSITERQRTLKLENGARDMEFSEWLEQEWQAAASAKDLANELGTSKKTLYEWRS